MAEKTAVSDVVMYEEIQGEKRSVRKARIQVFVDSSAKTLESLDPHLRSAFGLSCGSHLRSKREDWDTRRRQVRFTVGDLTKKRHFVAEFSGPLPEWSECDW